MHASLASIGRAHTVEDEDPPDTPRTNSIETQTEYELKSSMPGGLQELIDCAVILSATLRFLPSSSGIIAISGNKNAKTCLKEKNLPETEREGERSGVSISSLDRLAMLHKLSQSTQRTLHLAFLAEVCNELGYGLRSLVTYSAGLTQAEYAALRRLSSAHFPHRPLPFLLPATPQTDRSSNEQEKPTSALSHGTDSPHDASSSTVFDLKRRTQLGELRDICESLRQCLTQVDRLEHEQNSLRLAADGIANGSCPPTDCHVFTACTESFLRRHTGPLATSVLVAAHHLVYCGLRSLAKTDLTTFTHGELWEITRGIEELDILTKHLQSVFNVVHIRSLRRFLCLRTLEDTMKGIRREGNTSTFCSASMPNTLLCDPLMTMPGISIGYLFDLIARERSIRLANMVYLQLSAMIFIVPPIGSIPLQSYLTRSAVTPTSLVEAFRAYLHENYDRSASEYLRSEYEFISGFLDILSQSTNLLYEVQRLNYVYSTAEALLTRQSGRSDAKIPSPEHFSFAPEKETKLQHALSVEGKHGILMKGTANKMSRSTNPSSACAYGQGEDGKISGSPANAKSKKLSTHLQELLHRSDTLDRYVATGSCLPPFATETVLAAVINPSSCSPRHDDSAANTTSPPQTRVHPTVKKMVQWSDQRDIRTRHQVIGRYLEMTWCHTEHSLHNQLIWPPSELLVRGQSAHNRKTGTETCGSVTSCLLMPAHQLHTISRRIREVAKSDLFPAGLLPVLRSEALRLEELANNRRWLEAWLRSTGSAATSITIEGPDPSEQISPAVYRASSPPTPNIPERCALAFMQRVYGSPRELHDHLLPQSTWRAYQEVSLTGTDVDVTTVLRIVHSLTRHVAVTFMPPSSTPTCTGKREASLLCVSQVFGSIEQKLHALGLFSPSTLSVNVTTGNLTNLDGQKSNNLVCHLLYSLSRRLSLATNRLSSLLNARLCQVHLVSVELLKSCRGLFPSSADLDKSQQPICSAKLASAIRVMCLVQAKVCQLSDILHQLHRLFNLPLVAAVAVGAAQPDRGLVESDLSKMASPGWPSLFTCLSSQLDPTVASACKVASLVSTLCRWSARLASMQRQLLAADCKIQQIYSKLWDTVLSPARLSTLVSGVGDQSQESSASCSALQAFTSVIVASVPTCTAQVPAVASPECPTADCAFHDRVYNKVFATLVNSLCSVWLQQLRSDSLQENCGVMIRRHTDSLHLFTRLLLTSTATGGLESGISGEGPSLELLAQTSAQHTALATVLCESQAFQQLQSSTFGPNDHRLVAGIHNDGVSKCSDSNDASRSAYSSSLQKLSREPSDGHSSEKKSTSKQNVKERLASRLNSRGGALLSLATGVRTTFAMPLRTASPMKLGDRSQKWETSSSSHQATSTSGMESQRLAGLTDSFKLSTESSDSR